MAIIKSKQAGNFTVLPNEIFKSNLSIEATGMLSYFLSLPHDWVIYKTKLHLTFNISVQRCNKIFKELQAKGYLVSVKKFGKDGKVNWEHIVYDYPYNEKNHTTNNHTMENHTMENHTVVDHTMENLQLINTNELNTNKLNINKLKKEKIYIREFVFLTQSELNKLKDEYSEHELNWMFDKLNNYKASIGKTYKSDYGAINNWVKKAFEKEKKDFIKDNNTSEVRIATAMKAIENINWDDYTNQL